MYTTLIDTATLFSLDKNNLVIVDCRFSLADVAYGSLAYAREHIPGAIYTSLDDDLSGPPLTDHGRHPLPSPEALMALFDYMGICKDTQVVAYDDANGMIASRLWWMLRYMGHTAVSVLDGGWQAWQEAELPTIHGIESPSTALFKDCPGGSPHREWLALHDEIPNAPLLIDSRKAERYRGEIEELDLIAGHISGAVNYFYERNWDENGRYLPKATIKAQFEKLLGDTPVEDVIIYCGSGVSSCVNLLAMAYAGMGNGRLYVGSWSEQCYLQLNNEKA